VSTEFFSSRGEEPPAPAGGGADASRAGREGPTARAAWRSSGGREEPARVDLDALEEQQARVVTAVRRARGAPVSYEQLREQGIEFPAAVVSELELAGVPVERCYQGSYGAHRTLGVRMDPARDPGRFPPAPAGAPVAAPSAPRGRPEPAAPAGGGLLSAALDGAALEVRRLVLGWPPRRPRTRRRLAGRVSGPEAGVSHHGARGFSGGVSRATWSGARDGANRAYDAVAARMSRRWLVPAALVVFALMVIGLIADALGGSTGPATRRVVAHQRARHLAPPSALADVGHRTPRTAPPTTTTTATQTAPPVTTASTTTSDTITLPAVTTTTPTTTTPGTVAPPAVATSPTPVSPVLAAQLEAQGHDLLVSGQYAQAIGVLHRALVATGEHVATCTEPTSDSCFTYAYALYDLGRALRLGGRPGAAVPVLERRLQIDDQRTLVAEELSLARSQAAGGQPAGQA
jgi:hypothetical protein